MFISISQKKMSNMVMRLLIFVSLLSCSVIFVKGQMRDRFFDPEAIVNSETVQQKWALMEFRMKSLTDATLKMLLPSLMEESGNMNISSSCVRDSLKIFSGLKKLKTWAIKFLDASSKSIDGAMSGTVAAFGSFDECVNNQVLNERSGKHKGEVLFTGQYCRVEIRPYLPPKISAKYHKEIPEALRNFTFKDSAMGEMAKYAYLMYFGSMVGGICVPSGCSEDDVNQVLRKAGDYIGVLIKTTRCEVKEENNFTPLIISILSLYSFLVLLVVLSTAVEVHSHYTGKKFKGTGFKVLNAFSFISNFRKLTDLSASTESFSCLNGLRTLTMGWVILGHTYTLLSAQIQSLPWNAEDMLKEFAFQGVINSTFNVDTFFIIGAMLLSYGCTKYMRISKKPFHFGVYVSNRIWRILPPYALVLVFSFLMPLLGSGPLFHELIDYFVKNCEKNWWAALLFINNFYDTQHLCMAHGWYLTVDMQLYIAALIVILPLMKHPKVGIGIAVTIIFGCLIGTTVHVYVANLPPSLIITPDVEGIEEFFRSLNIKPHAHGAQYCIGLLCGYLLATRPKLKIPKFVQILGWCLTIAFSFSVVNGVQQWNSGVQPTPIERIVYPLFGRLAWSLAVAWVLIVCITGHGGIVNMILSWKAFVPLGRLTFMAYLVHPHIVGMQLANIRTVVYFDHMTAVWLFFGHVVASYLAAFIVSMVIESPFLSLGKMIFSPEGKKTLPQTQKDAKPNIDIAVKTDYQKDGIDVLHISKDMPEDRNGILNTGFISRL